ncbi:MAG: tripartite tricarboxylate transporter substrate binding protein [Xanthobacteraceae bacterium]
MKQYELRRVCGACLIAAASLFAAVGARGDSYPDRAVRLIIPFPPGGSIDTLGRILMQKLGAVWSQSTVVENRPGAGGNIGSAVAARAAPDGYTLLFAGQFMAANVTIAPMQGFNPATNLAPVDLVATGKDVLLVPPNSPFHSVGDIVTYAKAHPGQLTYASLGVGSSGHLATILFSQVTGITMQHVPYTSFGTAVADVGAGRVSVWLATLGGILGQVQGGKFRALAVSGPERATELPNVPTFAELGVPYGNDTSWYALFAPAGTPPAIIAKINGDTDRMLTDPDLKSRVTKLGFRLVGSSPEQLGTYLKNEIGKWATIAKAGGIVPK